jgi:uncharacterized protein (DUF58 family)
MSLRAGLLRGEAEALAHDVPGMLMEARRLAAAASGAHGRRQAGPGEAFWQFRDHRPEDGVRAVDWRRSARGDRLFVREREREAAQSAQFWLDPSPGFAWRGGDDRHTKVQRAATVLLACALVLWRAGERVGPLGGAVRRMGAEAPERLAEALFASPPTLPEPALRVGLVLASDGYAPLEDWRAKLAAASAVGAFGAVLLIADPAEEDFPFAGRTEFTTPAGDQKMILGRAEEAQSAYKERLDAHRAALIESATAAGFAVVLHRTDRPAALALAAVLGALEKRR